MLRDDVGQPLFRRIVAALVADVGDGTLTAGTKLPTHRDLADDLSIARGTVARAYRCAEALGVIRSDVGRGTYVLPPDAGARRYASLLLPPTVVSDLVTNVPLSGIDPDLQPVLRKLADRPDRASLLRYHPPVGLDRHRAAGVKWLERLGVRGVAIEDLLLCSGAQHALFVTLWQLSGRSSVLYVEELTYPGIHGIVEHLQLKLVPVRMDHEGMRADCLDRAARQFGPGSVYCMPTIHNPTGAVMSSRRRADIAAVARARDLFLVEDAANRMLAERPPPTLFSHAPERTVLIATVSKVLGAGLRLAFVLANADLVAGISRRAWATHWMSSPIGAEIVSEWLEDGTVDKTVVRKRREAARRQVILRRVLGGTVTAHPASLHAWIELPAEWPVDALVAEAARQRIVVTPSTAFWTRDTAAPSAIRIALGGTDRIRDLRSGLTRLAGIVLG